LSNFRQDQSKNRNAGTLLSKTNAMSGPPEEPSERSPEGISLASLAAGESLPAARFADSAELGWRGVMARAYVDPPETDGFTTMPTDDLLVCVTLRGTYKVECQRPKGWSWAIYRPGAVGLTAPGTASSLRWKSTLSGPLHSLHIHLGRDNLERIAAAMSISDVAGRLPDVLLVNDEFTLACTREIWRSLRQEGSALHAETIAEAMGSHLMVRGERLRARSMRRPADTGALSRGSIKRIREYMLEHLAETVSLNDLALVANMSKFHLVRRFKAATGTTPHQYLVALRMHAGADLLRSTQLPVKDVAARCGYRSASQFSTAVRRHHGVTPVDMRQSRA
jgi:AraC family transcriptional regulator